VPFAPKDLRSSFTTFLLSDANSRTSALKKAVAHAMRHSTAQQGSAAYEKGRAERTRAAEVQDGGGRVRRALRDITCVCSSLLVRLLLWIGSRGASSGVDSNVFNLLRVYTG